MESYLSLKGLTETKKTIEKSVFITTSTHIENQDEVDDFLCTIREKYKDATHNCYAYIADITGNFLRFFDDGEPQGTAGMPILNVLKNKKLMQSIIIVTRYFGGIKLGAGGLTRAYSSCAAENIEKSQVVLYEKILEAIYEIPYSQFELFSRGQEANEVYTISIEYLDFVKVKVKMKENTFSKFNSFVSNLLSKEVKPTTNIIIAPFCK